MRAATGIGYIEGVMRDGAKAAKATCFENTYKNDRQCGVIAARGHKYLGTGSGDALVAYALPQ